MNIDAKQAGTILIAFIFVGSSVAFALNWTSPGQEEKKTPENLFLRPLSSSERQTFLGNDITVLTLFFGASKGKDFLQMKDDVEKLAKDFGNRLIVEEIDVNTFQSFSAEYDIRYVLTVIIRGKKNVNAPLRLEGIEDYETLRSDLCSTYESKPTLCG